MPDPLLLNGDRPLVLLPVRLETRFFGQELRIRVFPDKIHVDTHEPELTADEVEWGKHFHTLLWNATTEEARKNAWQQLADRYGAERASWIVRHYEERPEIEQDYEQMKSGGWQLQKLSSTRYSEIVFYVLTVVLSYSLYHLFANTQAGARFADKTRQALAFEQLRTQRTHIIVYAGGHFEIFETLRFVQMILQLSSPVQEHLGTWLSEHLNQIQKRE